MTKQDPFTVTDEEMALYYQSTARHFHRLQNVYRDRGELDLAIVCQSESATCAEIAMDYLRLAQREGI